MRCEGAGRDLSSALQFIVAVVACMRGDIFYDERLRICWLLLGWRALKYAYSEIGQLFSRLAPQTRRASEAANEIGSAAT